MSKSTTKLTSRFLVPLLLVLVPAAARAQAPAVDFIAQAKELYRVAACGGDDPVPEKFDPKVVDAHCRELGEKMGEYRKKWVEVAEPFLAGVVPADLPTTVVYPFGGGDLLTALATFPAAKEITTLSLEKAGDARLIDRIGRDKLRTELDTDRKDIARLFKVAHSKTTNLEIVSTGSLPGELVFVLTALAVYDYEPLTLKYFRLGADGQVGYVTEDDLKDPRKKDLFHDMEIAFRKRGVPTAPVRVYRHISANLDDKHLKSDPSALRHLEAKGQVAAMTKAASYLLWWPDFSTIRNYLLGHMVWMISDSTGILPHFAQPAGFEQITYGTFDGPFLAAGKAETAELKKLWQSNPHHDLAFRYGYPDSHHHSHLMITRKTR
jgi:hypothetical protein